MKVILAAALSAVVLGAGLIDTQSQGQPVSTKAKATQSAPGYIDIIRSGKNKRVNARISGVKGAARVIATTASGKRIVRTGRLQGKSSRWDFRLPKRVRSIEIRGVGFTNPRMSIPNRRFSQSTFTNGYLMTGLVRQGGPASSYRIFPANGRWDTCLYKTARGPRDPDHYYPPVDKVTSVQYSNVINYGGRIPERWRKDLAYALTQVERATGYRFVYQRNLRPERAIRFDIRTHPALYSSGGSGGYLAARLVDGYEGRPLVVQGYVEANINYTWGQNLVRSLLMHEISHALGLGHTDDPRQIMFGGGGDNRAPEWGPGDRAGLRVQGMPSVCPLKVGDVSPLHHDGKLLTDEW